MRMITVRILASMFCNLKCLVFLALPTLATMYATSLSSLYFAVDSLLDMVDELPVKVSIIYSTHTSCHTSILQLPVGHMTAAPLYYTADDDDASTIDGNFIARLGLLSVHVFYANQHWEKLLHCGGRLLYGMRCEDCM